MSHLGQLCLTWGQLFLTWVKLCLTCGQYVSPVDSMSHLGAVAVHVGHLLGQRRQSHILLQMPQSRGVDLHPFFPVRLYPPHLREHSLCLQHDIIMTSDLSHDLTLVLSQYLNFETLIQYPEKHWYFDTILIFWKQKKNPKLFKHRGLWCVCFFFLSFFKLLLKRIRNKSRIGQ